MVPNVKFFFNRLFKFLEAFKVLMLRHKKSLKIIILISNILKGCSLICALSNLLYGHSKCGGSCSFTIMKAGFVALCAYVIKQSSSCHILNVHKATLGAPMMSQKKEKNTPNWEPANKIHLSLN